MYIICLFGHWLVLFRHQTLSLYIYMVGILFECFVYASAILSEQFHRNIIFSLQKNIISFWHLEYISPVCVNAKGCFYWTSKHRHIGKYTRPIVFVYLLFYLYINCILDISTILEIFPKQEVTILILFLQVSFNLENKEELPRDEITISPYHQKSMKQVCHRMKIRKRPYLSRKNHSQESFQMLNDQIYSKNKATTFMKTKRGVTTSQSCVDEAISEYLAEQNNEIKRKRCAPPNEKEDDLDHPMTLMSSTIRKLPARVQADVKFRIHSLVNQAEMKYMYPSDVSSIAVDLNLLWINIPQDYPVTSVSIGSRLKHVGQTLIYIDTSVDVWSAYSWSGLLD